MPQAEYSFTLPLGFALVGGSTSPTRAPAPRLAAAAAPTTRAPTPSAGTPAPLARESTPGGDPGWPDGLPIGLRQDQERARSREALMRSGATPRRGRIEEGATQGVLSRLSPRPPDDGTPQPPDAASPRSPDPAAFATPPRLPEAEQPSRVPDMEELCEELIARLRRELLVERERMGTLFGA
jgi:hypothetical protein